MSGISLPFFDIYGALMSWVLTSGHEEVNSRTKHRVKVGRGGTSFRLDLSDGMLPTAGYRKLFPKSAAAEVAWFLMGTQDATFIRKHAPLWDKFIEPLAKQGDLFDGDGAVEGIKAAYGYRWRRHFGRDQLIEGVNALSADPSDRRVVVVAWDPAEDGNGAKGQKNVPCPMAFTLSLTAGELHSSLMIRSSDIFVGLPYDVMGHALLLDAIAATLRVKLGVMHITLAHPHLYEDHWGMAEECLRQAPVLPDLQLPGFNLQQIMRAPDDYVARVAEEAASKQWPSFNPRPFVVE